MLIVGGHNNRLGRPRCWVLSFVCCALHDGMQRRRRESHGWRVLLLSGRVTDPERAVAIRSQSDGCACVHETGWLWPLRMAKRAHEWAASGAERRNTAAYGHTISLSAFRTVLGVGVDEAGSIFWRSRTRRLVDLAARRLVGPSAHRPSGRGPGSGFALERRIAPPSRAGGLMPRRG